MNQTTRYFPGYLTLLFLLIGLCPSAFSQNKPITVLPFLLKSDHRLYVKCQVNDSDTLSFLFDTGANPIVINQSILGSKVKMAITDTVKNNGTNGVSYTARSKGNKLTFGEVSLDSVSFVNVAYGEDAPFDGVFGSDIMRNYVIEINYKSKKLSFYNRKTYQRNTQGYTALDLKFILGVPLAQFTIVFGKQSYTGRFEVDSGSDNSLIRSNLVSEKYNLKSTFKPVARAGILGSDGTQVDAPIIVIPEIAFKNKWLWLV